MGKYEVNIFHNGCAGANKCLDYMKKWHLLYWEGEWYGVKMNVYIITERYVFFINALYICSSSASILANLIQSCLESCASEHLTPNREMLCQIPEASSLILQYLPLPQYLQIQYTTWIKVFHCYKNIRHQK